MYACQSQMQDGDNFSTWPPCHNISHDGLKKLLPSQMWYQKKRNVLFDMVKSPLRSSLGKKSYCQFSEGPPFRSFWDGCDGGAISGTRNQTNARLIARLRTHRINNVDARFSIKTQQHAVIGVIFQNFSRNWIVLISCNVTGIVLCGCRSIARLICFQWYSSSYRERNNWFGRC